MSSPPMDIKLCALCGRGEKSLMGQGDLMRFEPTPGFNPFRKVSNRTNNRRSTDAEDTKKGNTLGPAATCRRARVSSKGKDSSRNSSQLSMELDETNETHRSQSQADGECLALPTLDELSLVGYPEEVDGNDIFEKSGHVTAHHCCAAWSDGVVQKEDFLCNVDKAVFAGLSQKCSYCLKYGATIKCKIQNCSNKYHYPCASGGGCFQDIKTLSLLCPEHADQAINIANQEACCVVCDEPGCISDQLFCTSCGQHYHGNCLDPTVEVNPVVRAGWQCPECKICQTCRQPGDDNKMLVCDTCDKGYHTFCLRPVMSTIPKNGWKCKNCRVCGDCGSRTPGSGPSSRWHLNYSVCDSCYQQRNKGLCCPICGKAYRHFAAQNKMLLCRSCKRHIHAECDESYEAEKKGTSDDYICVMCKSRDTPILGATSSSDSIVGLTEENKLQDIENFGIFKVLKESKLNEGNCKEEKSEESCKTQESRTLRESSESSSDLDLKVLDKNLSNDFGVMDDQSLSKQMIKSSDSKIATTPLSSSSSTRGSALTPALNQGKPQFNQEQYGKKIGARNKSRSVGVGKKKRPTHASDRKRGPKPKIKQSGANQIPREDQNNKDEEHTSTLVICSAKDQFSLKQDMCLSCGSFGKAEEGKLIACVQCGQCYHPYCVSIKVSPSMLEKGWRCLDCTVCEGCGKPHDESRLILCDECDISFHIYCLDPPLEEVPQGSWKCKWCIVCLVCGDRSPGTNCHWQDNYSKCGPCASLERCPVCNMAYNDLDLIIQCGHCERWIHGNCDGIKNEDDAESAIEAVYHCPLCRPITGQSGPVIPIASPEKFESPSKPPSPILVPSRELDLPRTAPKTYFIDGICLSEAGLAFIRKQSMRLGEKKRNPSRWKRTHPGLINMHLAGMSSERSEEDVDGLDTKNTNNADLEDCKMEGGQEDDLLSPGFGDRTGDGSSVALEEKKKRPRMRMGMGVGGFIPRSRTRGGGTNKARVLSGLLPGRLPSGSLEMGLTGTDVEDPGNMDGKKIKQRRPRKLPKRSHLEDAYPSYLQDAFFGRDLLDQYKPQMRPEDIDLASDEPLPSFARSSSFDNDPQLSKGRAYAEAKQNPSMRQTCEQPPQPGWMGDQQNCPQPQQTGDSSHQQQVPLDSLDVDSLDKDQAMDSLDQLEVDDIIDKFASSSEQDVLAQIDNETLEDILKNGLNGDPQQESNENFGMRHSSSFTPSKASSTSVSPLSPSADLSGSLFPHGETSTMWSQQPLRGNIAPSHHHLQQQQQQHFNSEQQHNQAGMFVQHPNIQTLDQQHQQQQIAQQQSHEPEEEEEATMEMTSSDNLTCNQRNIKKWQSDEMLGDSATISQVLYANMCHPELKQQYPEWSERVKQIAKLWRKVPTENRGPYLAKARANRAIYRSQNSQKESKKKQSKSETNIHQSDQAAPTPQPQDIQNANSGVARDASDPYSVPPATPQTSRSPSVGGFLHPSSQGMSVPPPTSMSAALFKQPHPKTPVMQQHYDSYQASRPPSRDYHALHQHQSGPMEHFPGSNTQSNEASPGHFAKHPFASPSPALHLERSASVDVMKHQQYQSPRHSQEGSYQGGDHTLSQMGHSASPGANMISPQQSPKIGRSMAAAGYQRSISDPYGGIRPPSDPYSQPPSMPRPEPYGQMYAPHVRADHYAQPPGTPRPDQFNQPLHVGDVHALRSSADPFAHHPRGNVDPYAQMPMTPRPAMPNDPYIQAPMTPRPNMGEFGQQMIGSVRQGTSPLHHININHTRMMQQQQNMMLQQGHNAAAMQGSDQFQNQARLLRPSGPCPGDTSAFMGAQQRMPGYDHLLQARYPSVNPHHIMNKEVYHQMSAGGQKPVMPSEMFVRASGMAAIRGPVGDFGGRPRPGFEANYAMHQKFPGSTDMYVAQQQPRLPHDISMPMRYPMNKMPQQLNMEVQQHEQEQAFLQQQHFQQLHQAQLLQKQQASCGQNSSQDPTNQNQGGSPGTSTSDHQPVADQPLENEPHTSSTQDSEETEIAVPTSESDAKPEKSKQQLRDLLAKQSGHKQKQKKHEEGSSTETSATPSADGTPTSTSPPSTTAVSQAGQAPGSSTPLKHWPVDTNYDAAQQQGMRTSNAGVTPLTQQQLHHMQAQHQQGIGMHQQDFSLRWPDQQAMLRMSHPSGMPQGSIINQQMDQSMVNFQPQQNCLMNENQLGPRFLVRPMRFSSSFPGSSNLQFNDDPNSYQQYQGNPGIDPRHQQMSDQQHSMQLQQQQQAGMRMMLRQGFMQQHQQLHPRMFQQVSSSDGSWKLGFTFQQQPQHLQQNQQHMHQVQQQMQQQFFKTPANTMPTSMASPSPSGHQSVEQSMTPSNFGMHHQITSLQHLLNQNQAVPSSQSAPSSTPSVPSSMLLGGDSPSKMVEGNTDDQIEDLLGSADDGFNLLEYADDDLECNDKTIFDEHLGLIPAPTNSGNMTSSNQSSVPTQLSAPTNEHQASSSTLSHSLDTSSERCSMEICKSKDSQSKSLALNKQKGNSPAAGEVSSPPVSSTNEVAYTKGSPLTLQKSIHSQEDTSQQSQGSSQDVVEEMEGIEESTSKQVPSSRKEEGSAKVGKRSPKSESVDCQLDGNDYCSNLDNGLEICFSQSVFTTGKKGKHSNSLTKAVITPSSLQFDKDDVEVSKFLFGVKMGGSANVGISLSPICQLDGAADDEDKPSTEQGAAGKAPISSAINEAVDNITSNSSEVSSVAQSDGKTPENCKEDGVAPRSTDGNISINNNYPTQDISCSFSSSVQSSLPVSLMSSAEAISLLPVHPTQQLHAQPQTMLQLQQHVQALQQRRMLPQQQHNLDPRIMQQQHLMMMAKAQIGLQQSAMDQLNARHDSTSQDDILLQIRLQQHQLLHMQQARQAIPDNSLQRFSVAPPPYQAPRAARARLQTSQLIPSSLYPLPRQQKWDMFQMGGQQQQLLQQQLQQQIFMQQQLQQQFPMNSMHLNQVQKPQDHNSPATTSTSADASQPLQSAPDACLPTSGSQGLDKIASIHESQVMDSATRQVQFEAHKNISALDAKATPAQTSAQSISSTTPNISNESTFPATVASTSSNVDLNVLSSVSTSMVNALLTQQLQARPQGLVCMRTGMPTTELRHQPPIKDTQQRLNLPSNLMGQPNIPLQGRPYLAPGSLVTPRMMPISSGLCMPRIARPLTQFNPMSAAAYQQQFSQGGRVITSLINMPGQLPPQSILSPKFFETPEIGQIGQRPPSKPHGEQPLLLEDLLEEAKQEQRRKQAEQQQSSSSDATNTQATPASSVPVQTPTHLPLSNDADFEKVKVDNPNLQDTDQQAALNRSHLLAQQQQLLQQQHQGIHAQQDPDLNWQSGTPVDNINPSSVGGPGFAVRPNLALPVRMTSSFVMSPQTFFDPSSLQMTGSGPVPEVLMPPPPQRPPDPPTECSTEEDKLVQKKYEEWLVHNEQWLTIQVQSFSDQVAKFRKTKKALTAKQRVARKNGNELNEGDAQNLEETSKEQSRLQKQLDQLRKQHRTHKTTIQEYKAKHQPITSMLPPPPQDDQQSGPSTSDQALRTPASTPTARLPPAARQEYDQYVQGRLKQMHPQGTLAAVRTTLLQGDDNNPFSESYQQREKLRMQAEQQRSMGSLENLGSSQNIDSVQFPGGGSDQFPVGMGPSPQPPGMRQPFINYPQQQASVNSLQFVGSAGARFGMKYPVFPNVDTSGITQQHGSLPGDTFQTVGLRLLTPGVSNEVPAFHSAQQGSLESEPANLDEKPKRKRKRRKSILEKDETMPPLRSNLRSDIEKSHFISAGTINRAPVQPDNTMDQQMMMMMMMKNNFPPNVMQPTDACANAPSESQQRLLQQVQHTTRINQFQSPTSFGTDSSTIDDTTNKMVSVQDAILRKLLDSNKLNASNNSSAPASSSKMSEDEDEPVSLTPEQQRTLAMIESMPLTIETNKDESSKKPLCGKDGEATVGLSAGEAQLQQLIKANSKSRHRRSPKQDLPLAPSGIPMQAVEAPGTKKRQKKSTQQVFTPQQMSQQQLLHQQIMQQQLFQQQHQQVQHGQHLLRQLDRPSNPPVDAKTRIDHSNLIEQLIRALQLQPSVLLKEPDVSINSNQFLHPNLRPGIQGYNADVQLCGSFGSLHSIGLPTLDYYSVQQFVPQLWLNKPVVSGESRDVEANRSAFGHGGSSTISSSSHGTPVEDIAPRVITIIPTATSPVTTTTPAPSTTTCSTSSKLQMVTSILNKSVQPTISTKLPMPPLVEPHHDSNDSSPMSMVSSSSPEPSIDDHPQTSAFLSTNDLLLLPDLKVLPKEVVQAESIHYSPACQDQEASQLMEVFEVKRELQQEEMSVDSSAKIEVEVKPPLVPDIRDDLHACSESSQRSPKSADHVSVMLTLSVSSAENINGVIAAIANLLKIAVPPTYEITRSPSPNSDTSKMPWVSNSRHRETAVNIQSLMRTKTHFCKNCDGIIIGPGVRKPKSDLFLQAPDSGNEADKGDFTFCGTACCLHFSSACRDLALGNAMKDKLLKTFASSLPTSSSPLTSQVEMKHSLAGVYDAKLSVIYSSTSIIPSTSSSAFSVVQPKLEGIDDYPMETSTVHSGSYRGQGTFTPLSSSSSSPIISAADHGSKLSQARKFGMRVLKHKAVGDVTGGLFKNKRMKYDSRIQRWKNFLVKSEKVQKLSSEKEITEIMEKQGSIIRVKAKLPDARSCILCKSSGDADTNGPGRLLLLNADKWVHLNCALWSYEVYETMNGALVNVDHACRRGMPKKCVVCNTLGATITCFQPRCSNQYHLDCAIKDKAVFYQDKTIICHQHANRADTSNVLSSLSVFRRVYVNRDEDKQVAKMMQHEDRKCMLRVGSLIVHNMGQLLLHQIQSGAFNNHDYIFPVGFKSSRFYWSYRQMNKRCRYICKIEDKEGLPEFSVTVFEKGFEQLIFKSHTCKGAWLNILEPLEKMRRDNDLVKNFPSYLSGEDLFGLTEPSILKLIESLPGIELLSGYNFKYGRTPLYKLPLAVNPSGCARTEPKLRTHFKRPQTLHSGSSSRSLPTTVSLVRSGDNSSPYLKQFVHSKAQQYRRLKNEWRTNVYLRRSNIQGLGLFAARELEKHTMVIEYIGELIRTEVSENREKIYNKNNRGVYMFRINETNYVVDATMCGGPARYINHSCNPNCVAELVPFEKEKDHKIIIITKRKIAQGEELCYDYKFDVEDDQHKIPCLCGAPNCRKWMN